MLDPNVLPVTRQTPDVALRVLEEVTGVAQETLLAEIPVLGDHELGVGVRDASDGFEDSHVGRTNAASAEGYFIVTVPFMNAEGVRPDKVVEHRSFLVHALTGAITEFRDFHGAEDWLSENVYPASH